MGNDQPWRRKLEGCVLTQSFSEAASIASRPLTEYLGSAQRWRPRQKSILGATSKTVVSADGGALNGMFSQMRRGGRHRIVAVVAFGAVLLGGCAASPDSTTASDVPSDSRSAEAQTQSPETSSAAPSSTDSASPSEAKEPPDDLPKGCKLLPGTGCGDVSLSGMDLSGLDLTGVVFEGTDLSGVNLSSAILKDTRFFEVQMQEANLTGADLTGVFFVDSNLSKVTFVETRAEVPDEDLIWPAEFKSSVIDGADFSRSVLPDANFVEASLTGAKFADAQLPNAFFAGGEDAERVQFVRADLTGAEFRALGDWSGADFAEANLTDAYLSPKVAVGNFCDAQMPEGFPAGDSLC